MLKKLALVLVGVNAQPPCERDLARDAYRLWLAEKYSIKKNDVLGRFVFENKAFDDLEAVLAFVHIKSEKEEAKLRSAKARLVLILAVMSPLSLVFVAVTVLHVRSVENRDVAWNVVKRTRSEEERYLALVKDEKGRVDMMEGEINKPDADFASIYNSAPTADVAKANRAMFAKSRDDFLAQLKEYQNSLTQKKGEADDAEMRAWRIGPPVGFEEIKNAHNYRNWSIMFSFIVNLLMGVQIIKLRTYRK